ncbi:hypothetical protein AKO1_008018, partial [Acrasis kona]
MSLETWCPSEHITYHDLNVNKNKTEQREYEEEDALMDLVSKLQNVPMNYQRPLWDIHIINDYSKGWAMFWRVHHCIGDGYSLESVFCTLCDNEHTEFLKYLPKIDEKLLQRSSLSTLKGIVMKLTLILWMLTGLISVFLKWFLAALVHDPKTLFKTGKLVEEKRLAWNHPNQSINVDECKEVAHKFKATVNDVMISCLSGGMQRYLERNKFK